MIFLPSLKVRVIPSISPAHLNSSLVEIISRSRLTTIRTPPPFFAIVVVVVGAFVVVEVGAIVVVVMGAIVVVGFVTDGLGVGCKGG